MIDITPFLQALIGLLMALVTSLLVPWMKAKTTAQQQNTLSMVVDVLVYAAEQMYASETGQFRLNYVKSELQKREFEVDIAAIEAAVKRMKDDAGGKP